MPCPMRPCLLGIVLIVLVVAALHGRSVDTGLMLDDNNHRAELREAGWSVRAMIDASHLGASGGACGCGGRIGLTSISSARLRFS